jgi:hypothetical protein
VQFVGKECLSWHRHEHHNVCGWKPSANMAPLEISGACAYTVPTLDQQERIWKARPAY